MTASRRLAAAFACLAWASVLLPAARAGEAKSCEYGIVVSTATRTDPAWAAVVAALEQKHRGRGARVIEWQESVDEAVRPLADAMPRHACFIARPEEAGRDFVAAVHRLARRLDDDPYGDVLWGILTGFDAANALAIATTAEPLVVKRVTAGTDVAMDRVVEGEWYCELEKNRMVRKRAGGAAEAIRGPDDTTAALAARLNDGVTDLFVTSGHATERDWQIGFRYRNGQFRSGGGRLWGLDTAGRKIPIESANPKVWLPVGNCLAGHIDGPDALALAFMNSCGVRQMIGYTVPTWFGYAGWGCLDTFVEQPGRYTLCEAFHANHHALVHRLETRAAPRDERGLAFDRDVVAFYGDPAWDARLAEGPLQFRQTLTERDGVFTLEVVPLDGPRSYAPVNTNGSQRGGRPILQFLPRRLADLEVVEGSDWKPVVTDTFVLVPLPPADSTATVRVSFRVR
jgi:zinc protease